MELISREMAIEHMRVLGGEDRERLIGILSNKGILPTIESRPKGKWLDGLNDRGFYNKCSVCGHCHYESYYHSAHPNYCPNCGTEMARGEE